MSEEQNNPPCITCGGRHGGDFCPEKIPLRCAYCAPPSFKGWINSKCPYCGRMRTNNEHDSVSGYADNVRVDDKGNTLADLHFDYVNSFRGVKIMSAEKDLEVKIRTDVEQDSLVRRIDRCRGRGLRPTVTISVAEFSLLNRRVGFLEGVLETLAKCLSSSDEIEVIYRAMERYKEICAER